MAVTRDEFIDLYEAAGGQFLDNTTRLITPLKLRTFSGNLASSALFSIYKTVTITAANLRACPSTPIEILSTPGPNKFHSIQKIVVSKKSGAVAFDFDDHLVFQSTGGEVQFVIPASELNVTGNVNLDLVKQGQKQIPNVSYVLTGLGSDATVGDGNLKVTMYYTDETVLT